MSKERSGTPGGIVVGVDGSGESRWALVYALDQARDRLASVHVITAYHPPRYWALPIGMPIPVTEEEIAQTVRAQTQSLVDELLAGDGAPPKCDVTVVAGSAAHVLVNASRDAEMIVVGHRGRGGFAYSTLGSVALRCVLEAHCSVTVVPTHAVWRPPDVRVTNGD